MAARAFLAFVAVDPKGDTAFVAVCCCFGVSAALLLLLLLVPGCCAAVGVSLIGARDGCAAARPFPLSSGVAAGVVAAGVAAVAAVAAAVVAAGTGSSQRPSR